MKATIIIMALIALFLQGCADTNQNSSITEDLLSNQSAKASVEKIEVFHFHGTNQCYSCKTVGAYANETVYTYYAAEIQSGKIVFNSVNYDLIDNKVTAMKYGVSGSSLWIGVYDSQGFHPEQNTNVWYKINDKQDFMTYLKRIIDRRLAGDFS
ncbi:MAG: nitrophenyl compound nitroreductase subunit ArsF family protein [Candidatus Woesearchaeota archaeon]